MKIFLTSLMLLTGLLLKAQVKVENIDYKYYDNKIVVNYNLSGDGIYLADLYYTKDNGDNWHGPLDNTNGDIYGITSGKGKSISYDILQDHAWFVATSLQFKVVLSPSTGTFIDIRDGIEYKWTRIGRQTWMAENLKAVKYPDGRSIIIVKSNLTWKSLSDDQGACCWDKKDSSNFNKYGVLYNWAAATNLQRFNKRNPSRIQGVCPDGWHLPSEAEWKELEEFICKVKGLYLKDGSKSSVHYVGKYLKSKKGWKYNGNGSDDFNFSAFPGGYRFGSFVYINNITYWYSSTQNPEGYIRCYTLYDKSDRLGYSSLKRTYGLYVRCLKD